MHSTMIIGTARRRVKGQYLRTMAAMLACEMPVSQASDGVIAADYGRETGWAGWRCVEGMGGREASLIISRWPASAGASKPERD